VIIGFPSNEFGGQESKPPAEIRKFVSDLGVKFPLVSSYYQVTAMNPAR